MMGSLQEAAARAGPARAVARPTLDALRRADWLNPERVRRIAALCLLAFALTFAVDVWMHTRHGVADARGEVLGRDFVNYWSGARLAAAGQAAAAYDIPGFWAYERSLTAPNAWFRWYSYPPVTMLLTLPLASLPFLAAWAAWTAAGLGLVAWTLKSSLGWRWAAVAAAATPVSFINVVSGQNGAFSAALMAGGVLTLERRPCLAGILFGLLCYKPHLSVLIPIALLAARQWRAILAAGATVIALVLASLAVIGWDAWVGFIHNAPMNGQTLATSHGMWPRIPSVYLAARWLGADNAFGLVAQGLVAVIIAALLFAIWRGGASLRLKGAALVVGTFLTTPYVWDYDMIVLTVAAVWFWREAQTSGWRSWEKLTLALLLTFPLFTPLIAYQAHIQVGPAVLGLMFALVARRALARPGQAVPRAASEAF